jgi:GAF domain-containing protein
MQAQRKRKSATFRDGFSYNTRSRIPSGVSGMAQIVADLQKVIDELVRGGGTVDLKTLGRLAEQISKYFSVKQDEVGLLSLVLNDKFLKFIIPEKLQQIGNIPLTSTTALAARTARDKRPEVINNFSIAKHSTVFEAVPLGAERGDPIQKIMSAPIMVEGKLAGVIQVSRKGKTLATAGADFTPKDLTDLVAIGQQIGRIMKQISVS